MLRRLRWALLWALLILVLCLMPGAALPVWRWADLLSIDKLVHAALFAVLAVLALNAVGAAPATRAGAVAALCIAYGGGLELLQQLPALGRRGDWNDFIANTAGVAAGWGWHRWRAARRRLRPSGGHA